MNISEKIKEMQDDLGKCHELEKNKDEGKLENMIMLMLSDGGYLGPGKIIGESSELLDFMFNDFIIFIILEAILMNFSEKVAEINGKVKSYRLEIEGVEKIPAEEMVRVMLEEGQMLEPCRIIGESDKEKIVGFGTFNKPLEELDKSEEKANAVPAALYM